MIYAVYGQYGRRCLATDMELAEAIGFLEEGTLNVALIGYGIYDADAGRIAVFAPEINDLEGLLERLDDLAPEVSAAARQATVVAWDKLKGDG